MVLIRARNCALIAANLPRHRSSDITRGIDPCLRCLAAVFEKKLRPMVLSQLNIHLAGWRARRRIGFELFTARRRRQCGIGLRPVRGTARSRLRAPKVRSPHSVARTYLVTQISYNSPQSHQSPTAIPRSKSHLLMVLIRARNCALIAANLPWHRSVRYYSRG